MSDVDFRAFLRDVCAAASFDSRLRAIEMIRAVLRTLAECLPGTLVNDLVSDLPAPLAASLRCETWKGAEPLTAMEFVSRVALREHTTLAVAAIHTAIVIDGLGKALPGEMLLRLTPELPAEYAASLAAASKDAVGSRPLEAR